MCCPEPRTPLRQGCGRNRRGSAVLNELPTRSGSEPESAIDWSSRFRRDGSNPGTEPGLLEANPPATACLVIYRDEDRVIGWSDDSVRDPRQRRRPILTRSAFRCSASRGRLDGLKVEV